MSVELGIFYKLTDSRQTNEDVWLEYILSVSKQFKCDRSLFSWRVGTRGKLKFGSDSVLKN